MASRADTKNAEEDKKAVMKVAEIDTTALRIRKKVIKRIERTKPTACGKLIRLPGIYLELGRHQFMFVAKPDADQRLLAPNADAGDAYQKIDQVTIRDINLHESLQKRGILRAIVQHLLKSVGGVQLEAIRNKGLLARVRTSKLWFPATPTPQAVDTAAFPFLASECVTYYRVESKASPSLLDANFSLF